MLNSRSKEIRVWWPTPLAVVIWLVIIWAFGFLLTSPKVEVPPPAPIEASFVELPEEKPQQKSVTIPQETAKTPPPPRPQPRLGVPKSKPAQPLPEKKGAPKNEAPATTARAQPEAPKDLTAYMNEARERRRAGGIFEDEPTEPRNVEREPSEEELRMANVNATCANRGRAAFFKLREWGPAAPSFYSAPGEWIAAPHGVK